jgi:hypothetical protein
MKWMYDYMLVLAMPAVQSCTNNKECELYRRRIPFEKHREVMLMYYTYIHGPVNLNNWWFFKRRADSESHGLCSLIVAGVSFEQSAFKVSDFSYKSSRWHVDCDVLAWNANFQKVISCPFETQKTSNFQNISKFDEKKIDNIFLQIVQNGHLQLIKIAHQWLFRTYCYQHFQFHKNDSDFIYVCRYVLCGVQVPLDFLATFLTC